MTTRYITSAPNEASEAVSEQLRPAPKSLSGDSPSSSKLFESSGQILAKDVRHVASHVGEAIKNEDP